MPRSVAYIFGKIWSAAPCIHVACGFVVCYVRRGDTDIDLESETSAVSGTLVVFLGECVANDGVDDSVDRELRFNVNKLGNGHAAIDILNRNELVLSRIPVVEEPFESLPTVLI